MAWYVLRRTRFSHESNLEHLFALLLAPAAAFRMGECYCRGTKRNLILDPFA